MAKKQRIAKKPQQITSSSGYHKRYLTSEWESFLNGWFVSDSSIDSVIAKYHTKTVRRSREQHRKNDYAKRYFQLLQTNVIGPDGIVLHALMTDKKGKRKTKKMKVLSVHGENGCASLIVISKANLILFKCSK